MKRILTITAVVWACVFSEGLADEEKTKTPSLEVLSSIVGASASSKEFRGVLEKYGFRENPKRDNSWGASGVFFEVRDGRVQVGIRPPSDATNLPTFPGKLPKNLKAGDSINKIREKLGAPLGTAHDPGAYYEMRFDGITVYTMGGTLFEVWLIPTKINKAERGGSDEPATAPESKAEGDGKHNPGPEARPE
jgi:hypothetical protein